MSLRIWLLTPVVMVLLTAAVPAADEAPTAAAEPAPNQVLAELQADAANAAETTGNTIQLTGERISALESRLFVLDFLNIVNHARLAGIGYQPPADSGEWHGELGYRTQWDSQSGSLDFSNGVRLELGYTQQLNDAMTIGITIMGGTGNIPGYSDFGFTDPELADELVLDQAWVSIRSD